MPARTIFHMFQYFHNRRKTRYPSKAERKSSAWRYAEYLVAAVFAVVVVLAGTTVVKMFGGVSRTVAAPAHMVRLQILDSSQAPGAAAGIAALLKSVSDGDVEIRIVGVDDFDIRPVERSFLISREADKTAATLLAGKIGLKASDVVYQPLENNYRQISATLVVGRDYRILKPQVASI